MKALALIKPQGNYGSLMGSKCEYISINVAIYASIL